MLNKIKKIKRKYILFLIFILALITPFTFSKYISKYTRYISISAVKSEYLVIFDANGGEGSMESQTFNSGTSQRLNKSKFTKVDCDFWKWNTEADGTGTSYADEAELKSLISENSKVITLYAMYSPIQYTHSGDITFDGNSYINTGIFLFNDENIKKDFEVSFEIKSRNPNISGGDSGNGPTIMSAMSEKGEPYAGMVYRLYSDTKDQLVVNATSTDKFNNFYNSTEIQKVILKRIKGIIYLSINDGEDVKILDTSGKIESFDYPVVFGAGLDENMQPRRWFQGILSNLKVVVIDNTIDSIRYNANGGTGEDILENVSSDIEWKLKKNTFKKDGYVFLNWNTEPDGTGVSYEDEEILTNLIMEDDKTLNLYAIYAREQFSYTGDIVFDSDNSYLNTEVYLFSRKNINKDFEVSFEVTSRVSTGDYSTIMSAMDERGTPWPGMVYRLSDEWNDELLFNVTSDINYSKHYTRSGVQKITLKRINGSIYLKRNDEPEEQLVDTSSILQPFNYPLVFGAGLDENMQPRRWFQGTLSNLKVVLKEPNDTIGKIRYNPNGGKGNPLSQHVDPNINTPYKLMKNTYVREDYVFNGWNTKEDGTGTSYNDEQEVNLVKKSGEIIDLYAQWKTYKYTIEYYANNGTDNKVSQQFDGGQAIQLNPKLDEFKMDGYNFAFWNTAENGTGVSYEYNETVRNLGTEENQVVKLYAMYEKYTYQVNDDITFDGKDGNNPYIDTHIYLFSQKNASKDFKISFTIKDFSNTHNYNTIISSLDESGKPYAGFVFRINDSPEIESTQKFNFEANVSEDKTKNVDKYYELTPQKIEIERVNGVLTLKRDNEPVETIINYSEYNNNFYYPVTVGASLDKDFIPWRHFIGTISDLSIELINPDIIE